MLKNHAELKSYKIVRNYRTYDENDSFETDHVCDYCNKPSELYVVLEGYIYICKGCLYKWEQEINKTFIEYMKKAERK